MHEWVYAIRNGFGTRFNIVTRTMDLFLFVNDIGGQSGDRNVPWERQKPKLGLSLVVSLAHSQPCFLCSAPAWWKEAKRQWLDRYDGSLVSQHNLFFGFIIGILLIMVSTLWLQVTGCGKTSLGCCLWENPRKNPYPFG